MLIIYDNGLDFCIKNYIHIYIITEEWQNVSHLHMQLSQVMDKRDFSYTSLDFSSPTSHLFSLYSCKVTIFKNLISFSLHYLQFIFSTFIAKQILKQRGVIIMVCVKVSPQSLMKSWAWVFQSWHNVEIVTNTWFSAELRV